MTIETTPQQKPLTQTLRAGLRSKLFWIILVIVALVLTAVTTLLGGGSRFLSNPLDPENPAPIGTMAVAEVLRGQGVDVIKVTSLGAAADAAVEGSTTLVLDDAQQYLDAAKLSEVSELADTFVLINPSAAILDVLAPDVAPAGHVDGVLSSDCSLGAVERAATVTGTGTGFRLLSDSTNGASPNGDSPDAIECLDSGDGIHSLIRVTDEHREIYVLGATEALSNDAILDEGNAAFALGLLGENPTLVWYLPGPADLDAATAPTASELTPDWVPSIALLALLVTIAAAVWRGRRMGPLVVERLPVTVPSTETMEGRARLYQKSSARVRALDSLRIGTIQRLAGRLHLPRTATVDDVAYAAAGQLGRPVADIQQLLIGDLPTHDRNLIELSDQLLLLERAVADATTPR